MVWPANSKPSTYTTTNADRTGPGCGTPPAGLGWRRRTSPTPSTSPSNGQPHRRPARGRRAGSSGSTPQRGRRRPCARAAGPRPGLRPRCPGGSHRTHPWRAGGLVDRHPPAAQRHRGLLRAVADCRALGFVAAPSGRPSQSPRRPGTRPARQARPRPRRPTGRRMRLRNTLNCSAAMPASRSVSSG